MAHQQPYGAPQMANPEWASGLFDVCAAGSGFCLYATFCTPCAYGDVKQEFTGEGWCFACLGWLILMPCHLCCFHPDLRRQIAMKHGKNVDALLTPPLIS